MGNVPYLWFSQLSPGANLTRRRRRLLCGVVPTLQCINRDDIRGGVAQDCLANLRKLLDLLGCEVVKNLVAHLSDVAGGYFLNLLLAGGRR